MFGGRAREREAETQGLKRAVGVALVHGAVAAAVDEAVVESASVVDVEIGAAGAGAGAGAGYGSATTAAGARAEEAGTDVMVATANANL